MKNTPIKKEDYERLKTTGINLIERLEKARFTDEEINIMVNNPSYSEGKINFQGQILEKAEGLHGSSFAHFSSFLYYEENKEIDIPRRSKEVIKYRNKVDETAKKDWYNIEVLQDWNKISGELKAGYVFIGANAGTGVRGLSFERFENFHNTSASKIKKYRACFESDIEHITKDENGRRVEKKKCKEKRDSDIKFFEDNVHGSYITDIVKGLPTANSKDLENMIIATAELTNDNIWYLEEFISKFANLFVDLLVDELKILGNVTHTLIIMNARSNKFIREMLCIGKLEEKYKTISGDSIRICRMSHYSARATPYFNYQKELEEIFNR